VKAKNAPVVEQIAPTYFEEESDCKEEYHDCFDKGEAVVCKGSFEQCKDAFDDCSCGCVENNGYAVAENEIDTTQKTECETGVFVCNRQVITMSGEIAESKVTCKGTFSTCAVLYGDCKCGDSSLTDFPTNYVGGTSGEQECNDTKYYCDFKGHQVPCYMIVENCAERKNTCFNANGRQVTCVGTFDYCQKTYADNCVCGLEALGVA
jgi:hypothetical protein